MLFKNLFVKLKEFFSFKLANKTLSFLFFVVVYTQRGDTRIKSASFVTVLFQVQCLYPAIQPGKSCIVYLVHVVKHQRSLRLSNTGQYIPILQTAELGTRQQGCDNVTMFQALQLVFIALCPYSLLQFRFDTETFTFLSLKIYLALSLSRSSKIVAFPALRDSDASHYI